MVDVFFTTEGPQFFLHQFQAAKEADEIVKTGMVEFAEVGVVYVSGDDGWCQLLNMALEGKTPKPDRIVYQAHA